MECGPTCRERGAVSGARTKPGEEWFKTWHPCRSLPWRNATATRALAQSVVTQPLSDELLGWTELTSASGARIELESLSRSWTSSAFNGMRIASMFDRPANVRDQLRGATGTHLAVSAPPRISPKGGAQGARPSRPAADRER